MTSIVLELPLPPSPNDRPAHLMQFVKWKNRIKRVMWCEACGQALPSLDPPDFVTVAALFRVTANRDEDNLKLRDGSLKYVLDALRKPQNAQEKAWRRGIHEDKGFMVDDSPEHMQLTTVMQIVVKDPKETGLRLHIQPGP